MATSTVWLSLEADSSTSSPRACSEWLDLAESLCFSFHRSDDSVDCCIRAVVLHITSWSREHLLTGAWIRYEFCVTAVQSARQAKAHRSGLPTEDRAGRIRRAGGLAGCGAMRPFAVVLGQHLALRSSCRRRSSRSEGACLAAGCWHAKALEVGCRFSQWDADSCRFLQVLADSCIPARHRQGCFTRAGKDCSCCMHGQMRLSYRNAVLLLAGMRWDSAGWVGWVGSVGWVCSVGWGCRINAHAAGTGSRG